MLIGIISDIHDNVLNLHKVLEKLKQENVSLIIFCGDLINPLTINELAQVKIPVKAVFGNMDKEPESIVNKINKLKLDFEYPKDNKASWDLLIDHKKVAILHGDGALGIKPFIKSGLYDFVLSGHTHIPKIEKDGKTLSINPGPVCGWKGLDFIPTKPSFAILDTLTEKAFISDF